MCPEVTQNEKIEEALEELLHAEEKPKVEDKPKDDSSTEEEETKDVEAIEAESETIFGI